MRLKTTILKSLLCQVLLFMGVTSQAATADLRGQMDSIRRVLPSLKGEDRKTAWTRLYYSAYGLDKGKLALTVLNEWISDAHQREEYWSESVARQNKIVDFYNSAQYDSVIATAITAMAFCREHQLTRKFFEAWHLMTCSYHVQGHYNTAIREGKRMHEEALQKNDVFGQSMAYYNMGNVYYTMRHFPQSVKAFEESVKLLQNGDSTEKVLLELYPYYGDALEATKNYEALEKMTHEWWVHIQHMGTDERQIDMSSSLANYYIGRTQALLGLKRIEEACEALDKAAENISDSTSYEWLYLIYYRAHLAAANGQYDEALRLNAERLKLCRVVEDKPTLIPVHLQRAEILLAAGRYKEAAEMYRRTYEMSDSLNTQQTREQLNEMNTLFQVDELKVQNVEQQNRYWMIIGIMIILGLLVFLIHRYVAARRLQQKNDELARSNAELKIANEKAQESSRMKSAFIRNISHEIRTPLNILNGFTQVLIDQEGQLSGEEKANISQNVEENSKRMSELVNKMLEMSETSSSSVIERTDSVTTETIVEGAVKMSGVTLTTAPGEPASPVRFAIQNEVGKELLITTNLNYAQRALRHLLENARKFTRQGSVNLRVYQMGQMVAFVVEDTGIGIPEDARETIFGEFVKLNDYVSGTGIGLPLARSIARKLGGDLVFDSTYKQGAKFVMTLPV